MDPAIGSADKKSEKLELAKMPAVERAAPDSSVVEDLISINNALQQQDAAIGILTFAQQQYNIELKESWYEKLQRWDDALVVYEGRQESDTDIVLGKMRCLHALGDWDRLSQLAQKRWFSADDALKKKIAPLAAAAAWGLKQWEAIDDYIVAMPDSKDGFFFGSIRAIERNSFAEAQDLINKARQALDTDLKALVGESYSRAYK